MKFFRIACIAFSLIFGLQANFAFPIGYSSSRICTAEYVPVCGKIQTQCLVAPCIQEAKTFSNSCLAQSANAMDIVKGSCKEVVSGKEKNAELHECKSPTGYTGESITNKCTNPSSQQEGKKKSPRGALMSDTWNISSYNGISISQSGTLQFSDRKFTAHLCNTFHGGYGILGERLLLRSMSSTRMYCDSPLLPIESALYFSPIKFMVGENILTMTTKDGNRIIWKK